MKERPGGRGFALTNAAAVAAGLAVAGVTLGREPLWNDEFASLALVERSFGAMVRQFPHEHNGILFDVALWPIVRLGGTSADWVRLPALIAVALAVIVCALVGRRLAGNAVGGLAALFLAVNPFAVRYAQEGRMYGFALLFALVGVWSLLRAIDRPTRLRWSLYALAVAATGYAHDFALLTVAAHPLLVWRSGDRRARRGLLSALGVAALLLVPLAVLAVTDWSTGPLYWVTRPGLGAAKDAALEQTGSKAALAVVLVVLGAGAIALRRRARRGETLAEAGTVAFLLVWLIAPFVVLFVASQAKPLLVMRYLLPSVPALCLLLALAIVALGRTRAVAGSLAVAAAFLLATVSLDRTRTNPAYPQLVAYLHAHEKANESVVAAGDALLTADALLYYGLDPGFDSSRLLWTQSDRERLPGRLGLMQLTVPDRQTTAEIRNLLARRAGLWVVLDGAKARERSTPFMRWPPSQASGWERFRGAAVVHLLPRIVPKVASSGP